MSRRYGRYAKNWRLIDKAPHGRWKTTTFVTALRNMGLTAPMVLDGPINGDSFRAWGKQFLLLTLAPRDVVIMDNLSAHKEVSVEQAIQARGALYLSLILQIST
jgi:hypothetical protein